MKGLAALLGGKGPASKDAKPSPFGDTIPAPAPEEETEESSGALEFAKIASEAIAAGDHEAAADALVSMCKACK